MAKKRNWKRSLAFTLAMSTAFAGFPVTANANVGETAGGTNVPKAAYYWDFEGESVDQGATLVGDAATLADGTGDREKSRVLNLAGTGKGSDYMSLPEEMFSGVGNEGFTLSMWVKPTGGGDFARVFDVSDQKLGTGDTSSWSSPDFTLAAQGSNSQYGWMAQVCAGNSGGKATNSAKLVFDEYLIKNEWNYLTVSVSPSDYSLYINGQKSDYSLTWPNDLTGALGKLFEEDFRKTLKYAAIGRSVYSTDSDLQGEVDNVSFFNKALTEDQVKELYSKDGKPDSVKKYVEVPDAKYKYNFEDKTVVKDALVGKASVKKDVNKGNALFLEGGSMNLPKDLFATVGDEGFTISMWVKAGSDTGAYTKVFDASNAELGKTYNGGNGWNDPDFALATGGGDYDLSLFVGEPNQSARSSVQLKYANKHISKEQWQHMTVSVSPTELHVYFDGQEVSYTKKDGTDSTEALNAVLSKLFADGYLASLQYASLASLQYASLGQSYYTSDANWQGRVDDVNFYDKALNKEQVEALYNSYSTVGNLPDPDPVSLTVDMAQKTGAMKHGSTGFLYGIGEANVPDVNLLTPINPYVCEQKAPEGMQHPNGDAIITADTFLQGGGDLIQIACPDYCANWPYEVKYELDKNGNKILLGEKGVKKYYKVDFSEYFEQLRKMVQQVKEAGIEDKVVYAIFNEPAGNRFPMIDECPEVFNEASLVYLFYNNSFKYSNKGYGSAIVMVLLLIIMIITVIQNKLQKKWVNYM